MSETSDHIGALEQIVTNRFSCRAFTDELVDSRTLWRIFAVAQRTASWCNAQSWQVELLSGDQVSALADRLTAHVASHPAVADIAGPERYEGVYQERRRACGFALYESVGVERDDHDGRLTQMLENFKFFSAPHVGVVTSPVELGTYAVMDCGAYVANVLNAAEALGVNAIAQAAPAMYSDAIHDHLRIGSDRHVVCTIALGYADHEHPANGFRTDRADVADAVTGLDISA